MPTTAARSTAWSDWDVEPAHGCDLRAPLPPPLGYASATYSRSPARSRKSGTTPPSSTHRSHTPAQTSSAGPPRHSLSRPCRLLTGLRCGNESVNHVPGLFCQPCARSVPKISPARQGWVSIRHDLSAGGAAPRMYVVPRLQRSTILAVPQPFRAGLILATGPPGLGPICGSFPGYHTPSLVLGRVHP